MHFRPRWAHGISRSQTQPSQSPPRTRGRRRRLLVRLLLAAAVISVIIVSYLIFHDASFSLLDRQIQSRWLAATGLPLEFDRATLRLSRGTLDLAHPRLLDPHNGQILLNATRLRIEVPPGQFLWSGPPYAIRAIDIDSSLTLTLVAGDRGVTLGEPWAHIVSTIHSQVKQRQAARGDRKTSSTFALRHLGLNTLSVRLIQEQSGRPRTLTQINDARVSAEFDGQSIPRQFLAAGKFNDAVTTRDLTLELRPAPHGDSADLKLTLARFDSLKDLPWRLPVAFNASGLELSARFTRAGGERWAVTGGSTLRNLNLLGSEARPDQALGDAAARWDLAVDRAAGRLVLRSASLASRICSFQSSGTLALDQPRAYTLNVASLQAQGPAFALFADLIGRGPEISRPGEASLSLNATLRGSLARPIPDAIIGHVELAGLNIDTPDLPSMQNLRLQAELTSRSLLIERAQAIIQGMPMAFLGKINGQPFSRQITSADINWKADGDLVSVASMIKGGTSNASVNSLQLGGKVSGGGRFAVREPLAGTLVSVLERARLEGQIDLAGVTIRHPALLDPIRNLRGRIEFVENSARLTNGSGEWMGAAMKLSGQLKGKSVIWNQPRLSLTGTADFDLAPTRQRLAAASPEMARQLKSWPTVAGAAALNLTLDTALDRPAEADFSARLTLKNFSTDLTHPQINGRLVLSELRLAATPKEVKIERARGRLGALTIALDGALTPAGGSLHLAESGALAEVKRRIPLSLKMFRVAGTADLDANFTIAPRKGFAPPSTWQGLAEAVRALPKGTDVPRWVGARWLFGGGGELQAHKVEMTYNPMPARLWDISGPFRFDMTRLWSPKALPLRGGDRSRDCYGKIELVFGTNINDALQGRPVGPFVFNFLVSNGTVALDEWLKSWDFSHGNQNDKPGGPPKPPTHEAIDPNARRVFVLHGEFQLPQAVYLGVRMKNFHANLDLEVTPTHFANFFTWHHVTGQIGEGNFSNSGKMVGRDVVSDVSCRAIELDPLIKGLTGKEHVSGLFSGFLSGGMRLHQGWAWPTSPPLEGSGTMRITESRFVSNSVFRSLGGVLNLLPFFEEITFNTIEGPFEFRGDRYSTRGITFVNPMIVQLVAVGAFGPQEKLDLDLQLHILPRAIQRIPLVGDAVKLMNKLIGKVLKFKVRGTLDKPSVMPL